MVLSRAKRQIARRVIAVKAFVGYEIPYKWMDDLASLEAAARDGTLETKYPRGIERILVRIDAGIGYMRRKMVEDAGSGRSMWPAKPAGRAKHSAAGEPRGGAYGYPIGANRLGKLN